MSMISQLNPTLDVAEWIREAPKGTRAMLVVVDLFPFRPESYPIFIQPGDSIAQRFATFDGVGMQRVSAVHLLPHDPEH